MFKRRIIRPLCEMEMLPVSSETTTAMASLTSEIPRAALCRSPWSGRGFIEDAAGGEGHHTGGGHDLVINDDHSAVMQRSVGIKICNNNSGVTFAFRVTPVSIYSPSPCMRCKMMSAP